MVSLSASTTTSCQFFWHVCIRQSGRNPFGRVNVFVGFNLATAINANTSEARNMVTVYNPQEGSYTSLLYSKLAAGQNTTIYQYAGNTALNIWVNSILLTASPPVANVDISLAGCRPGVCGPACNFFCTCTSTYCTAGNQCISSRTCQQGSCVYNTNNCKGVFRLVLITDTYPNETSWEVYDMCRQETVLARDKYSTTGTTAPLSLQSTGRIGKLSFGFSSRIRKGTVWRREWTKDIFFHFIDGIPVLQGKQFWNK